MSMNGNGQPDGDTEICESLATESDDLPPGNHALEIAARRGIGPLSPAGREVWHGHTRPCVSCGQLASRDENVCPECGQDLSESMLEKMRAYAGPWYVLEHVRPFPGVRYERLVRQIRRGVLTETSIVRGPTTDHQWRFAGETPGLSKYFGRCWDCQGEIEPNDVYCPWCLAHVDDLPVPDGSLEVRARVKSAAAAAAEAAGPAIAAVAAAVGAVDEAALSTVPSAVPSPAFGHEGAPAAMQPRGERGPSFFPSNGQRGERETVRPLPAQGAAGAATWAPEAAMAGEPVDAAAAAGDLRELSQVVTGRELAPDRWDNGPPRIGGVRATWIVVFMVAACLFALVWVVQTRQQEASPPRRPIPYKTATPAVTPSAAPSPAAPATPASAQDRAGRAPAGSKPVAKAAEGRRPGGGGSSVERKR